jgi:hypothetical protein
LQRASSWKQSWIWQNLLDCWWYANLDCTAYCSTMWSIESRWEAIPLLQNR